MIIRVIGNAEMEGKKEDQMEVLKGRDTGRQKSDKDRREGISDGIDR